MKEKTTEKNSRKRQVQRDALTRTVKIADVLHHRIRVLSVQNRMPMQDFIERLLLRGLRDKVYEQFSEEQTAA